MKTLIEVEHEQGSAEQVVAYIRKMSGARIRILPQAKPAEGSHPDEDKLSLNGECGVSKRREGVVAPVADLHEFTDSIKEVASWLENNHYLTMAAKLRTALVMIAAMQKLADEEPARFEAWFRERVGTNYLQPAASAAPDAKKLAEAIYADVCNRRGIGHKFERFKYEDTEVYDEILNRWVEIITIAPLNHSSDVGK